MRAHAENGTAAVITKRQLAAWKSSLRFRMSDNRRRGGRRPQQEQATLQDEAPQQ